MFKSKLNIKRANLVVDEFEIRDKISYVKVPTVNKKKKAMKYKQLKLEQVGVSVRQSVAERDSFMESADEEYNADAAAVGKQLLEVSESNWVIEVDDAISIESRHKVEVETVNVEPMSTEGEIEVGERKKEGLRE